MPSLPSILNVLNRNGTKLLPDAEVVFSETGGFLDYKNDGNLWSPSALVFYDPTANALPAVELASAQEYFFLLRAYRMHSEPVLSSATTTTTLNLHLRKTLWEIP